MSRLHPDAADECVCGHQRAGHDYFRTLTDCVSGCGCQGFRYAPWWTRLKAHVAAQRPAAPNVDLTPRPQALWRDRPLSRGPAADMTFVDNPGNFDVPFEEQTAWSKRTRNFHGHVRVGGRWIDDSQTVPSIREVENRIVRAGYKPTIPVGWLKVDGVLSEEEAKAIRRRFPRAVD